MRQYAAALDGVKAATNIGAERTKPGSFNALCVSYYRSPEFPGAQGRARRRARRNIIERFRPCAWQQAGQRAWARAHQRHHRRKADTPEAANNLLKVLRVILDYAVAQDMIESNPAIGVKKYRSQARASTRGARTRSRSSRRGIRSARGRGSRSLRCSTPRNGAAMWSAWAGSM